MPISPLQANQVPCPLHPSAAVSHLCQLVHFVSIFLPLPLSLGSHLLCYLPPATFALIFRVLLLSLVTHLLLRYFGFITLQPRYREEPHGAKTEERKWGRADGRGWGRNPRAAVEKFSRGAVVKAWTQRTRPFQKQQ